MVAGVCKLLWRAEMPRAVGSLFWVSLILLTPAWSICQAQVDPANQLRRRDAFTESLLVDRRWPGLLRRIEEQRKAGDLDSVLAALQEVFMASEDTWVPNNEAAFPGSRRGAALAYLRQLGPESWALYEKRFGQVAQIEFKRAVAEGQIHDWVRVARHYPLSQAAFQAWDRSATWFLSRGDTAAALAVWSRELREPWFAGKLTAELSAKQQLAEKRLTGASSESLGTGPIPLATPVRIAGQQVTLENVGRMPVSRASRQHVSLWPVYQGDAERSRAVSGSVPFLKEGRRLPLSASPVILDSSDPAFVSWKYDLWSIVTKSPSEESSAGFAVQPVCVAGQIVFRDWSGVRAIHPTTGETLWHYSAKTSLLQAVETLVRQGIDLTVELEFDRIYRLNSILGWLSTDGQQVFLVDELQPQAAGRRPDPFGVRVNRDEENDPNAKLTWNRLVALRIPAAAGGSPEVAWTVGGDGVPTPQNPLLGHYFLGPPLPWNHALYVLAETGPFLELVCLHPRTGELIWKQQLLAATAGNQIRNSATAWQPTGSQDLLLCPTRMGTIIAVDFLTGELRWIGDCRDPHQNWPRPIYGYNNSGQSALSEFPSVPAVVGNRAFYLESPRGRLTCLDMETGKPLWQSDPIALGYLATATPDQVLVVTGDACQAYGIDTGEVRWSTRLGLVSGTGARVGDQLLIPLRSGRIAALDLATGKDSNSIALESEGAAGNLIPCGDYIVSCTPSEIQLYPQAKQRLKELETAKSVESQFLLAQLQLQLGKYEEAREIVRKFAGSSDRPVKSEARELLRKTFWAEWEREPSQIPQQIEEWRTVSSSDVDTARGWLALADYSVQQQDWRTVRESAARLSQLHVQGELLRSPSERDRQADLATWVRELRDKDARAHPRMNPAPPRIDFASLSTEDLKARLQLEPARSQTLPYLSAAIANREMKAGNAHKTELYLLQTQQAGGEIGLRATAQLAEFYDGIGLYGMAGRELHKYREQVADLQPNQSRMPKLSDLAVQAAQRFVPVDWPVQRVRIDEVWSDNQAVPPEELTSFARVLLPPQMPLAFEVLDRGVQEGNPLWQIDRETGIKVAEFRPDAGMVWSYGRDPAGHSLTLTGLHGRCLNWSFLERRAVWETPLYGETRESPQFKIGISTPHVTICQTPTRLVALNPCDGSILWQRDDLEPRSGLFTDPTNGLFGDDECLVVLQKDRVNYTAYRTLDGSIIRQGKLIGPPSVRVAVGRVLFYQADTDNKPQQFVLWDPLEDKLLRQIPTENGLCDLNATRKELAVPDAAGKVRIYDIPTGEIKLTVQLPIDGLRLMHSLKSFNDGSRYYLLVNRQSNGFNAQALPVVNPRLPLWSVHLPGELYAVDPANGEILWTRRIEQQSWLDTSDYRLPFVISLSQLRRFGLRHRVALRIEVIDGATGNILAFHEQGEPNFQPDGLNGIEYDRDAGQLELRGRGVRYIFEFGEDVQRFPRPNEGPM